MAELQSIVIVLGGKLARKLAGFCILGGRGWSVPNATVTSHDFWGLATHINIMLACLITQLSPMCVAIAPHLISSPTPSKFTGKNTVLA